MTVYLSIVATLAAVSSTIAAWCNFWASRHAKESAFHSRVASMHARMAAEAVGAKAKGNNNG